MTIIEEKTIEAIKMMTTIVIKMDKINASILSKLFNFEETLKLLNTNIDYNNLTVQQASDVINSNSVINKGLKDLIKDFSLYAASRQDADGVLQKNMDFMAETMNASIELFTEMKEIITGIYKFAEVVTNERSRVLTNMESDVYIGLNKLQEMFVNYCVEFMRNFAYPPLTSDEIFVWFKKYFIKYSVDSGMDNNLQYRMFTPEIIKVLVSDFNKKFKLGVVAKEVLMLSFIFFQSLVDGKKIVTHPILGRTLNQLKVMEDKLYG